MRLRLARERLALGRRRLLLAPLRRLRRDERERAGRRRAVVVGDPERELDERRRDLPDHASIGRASTPAGAASSIADDDAACARTAERDAHDRAHPDALVDLVGELAARRHAPSRADRPMRTDHLDRFVCSAREACRSRLNESVLAISPIAISPSTRLTTTIAMFRPTLNASSSEREIAWPRKRNDDQPLLRPRAARRRGEERRERVDDLREQRVVDRSRARRTPRGRSRARRSGRATRPSAAR